MALRELVLAADYCTSPVAAAAATEDDGRSQCSAAAAGSAAAAPASAAAAPSLAEEQREMLMPFAHFGLWPPPVLCSASELKEVGPLCLDWLQESVRPLRPEHARFENDELRSPDDYRVMRGGGQQIPVVRDSSLGVRTEAHMRRGLRKGLGGDATSKLILIDMALLVQAPGDGPQAIHADFPLTTDEERARAARCYSVLFFPSRVASTILPKLNYADHERLSRDRHAPQQLLIEASFFSVHVSSGSVLVFRGDVFHAGPKNGDWLPRVAVYAMFAPIGDAPHAAANFNNAHFPMGEQHCLDVRPIARKHV